MGGEENGGLVGGGRWSRERESIAFVIDLGVAEAEGAELAAEPDGADVFVKGWGGDGEEFELPAAELQLMEVKPVKSAVDGGVGGEVSEAALVGEGDRGGYSAGQWATPPESSRAVRVGGCDASG